MGVVKAVGPGKTEDGKLVPINLKKDQKVIYKKYSGTDVTIDKKDYLLISAEDILAVVE
jgi:chaperonin GroES